MNNKKETPPRPSPATSTPTNPLASRDHKYWTTTSLLFATILIFTLRDHGVLPLHLCPRSLTQQLTLLAVLFLYNYLLTMWIAAMDMRVVTDENRCVVCCPKTYRRLLSTRGSDYYMSAPCDRTSETCLLTRWGVSHILCYGLIGFLVPQLWWLTFTVGAVWEVWESQHEYHDFLDLIWNGTGIMGGVMARRALSTYMAYM